MSRQVKRWVSLGVLAAILATAFILLGNWQLSRLDERRVLNESVVAHESLPVQPYQDVMFRVIEDEDQWYRVTATGVYLPQQFQVRYRSNEDALGSEVVGVLATDQGDHLLVNRGFMVRHAGQPDGEIPAAASGVVTVTGYVRRNERGSANALTPHEQYIRLISSEAIGASLGKELVNGYITLTDSSPAEDAVLIPIARPDLSEGPHLSYALQWFTFTIIGVVGIGVLVRADVRDRKKAAAKAAAKAPLEGDDQPAPGAPA